MSDYIDFDEELEENTDEYEEYYEELIEEEAAHSKYSRVKDIRMTGNILPVVTALVTAIVLILGLLGYRYLTPWGKAAQSKIYTQSDLDAAVDETIAEQNLIMDEAVAQASSEGYTAGRQELLDVLQAGLEETTSAYSVIKKFYPESLIIGYQGAYHFVPISDEIPHNNYSLDRMVLDEETGEITYVDDNNQVISVKGIDVSAYQGNIDWKAVKEDGVEFAIIRTFYRGYGSAGTIVDDAYYKQNIEGAQRNGIKVGVYVFSQAINEAEGIEEAEKVLEQVKNYKLDLPIILDVELVSASTGRANLITPEERTKAARAFCDRIIAAGKEPMLYYNTQMGALLLDIKQFSDVRTWFAAYTPDFYWPYEYDIWQYSSTGTVKGIKGNVDMNIMMKPFE